MLGFCLALEVSRVLPVKGGACIVPAATGAGCLEIAKAFDVERVFHAAASVDAGAGSIQTLTALRPRCFWVLMRFSAAALRHSAPSVALASRIASV
jgi:hypothetical protein